MIEEKVLGIINGLITNQEIVNEVIEKITRDKKSDTHEIQAQIKAYKRELKKKQVELDKIDKDYFAKALSAKTYGRLSESIEMEVENIKGLIADLEKENEQIKLFYSLDEKIVLEALNNFKELFEDTSNENRKTLINSLIKNIEMETNRKDIKRISFWFLEDNTPTSGFALPKGKGRRTIS